MLPVWLESLRERDPSIAIALAALVRGAESYGRLRFRELVHAYRETFLASYRSESETSPPELSGDEVRENLTRSVLPRLADEGWIEDDSGDGWAVVRATGAWWAEAAENRAETVPLLLDQEAQGVARRQAPP